MTVLTMSSAQNQQHQEKQKKRRMSRLKKLSFIGLIMLVILQVLIPFSPHSPTQCKSHLSSLKDRAACPIRRRHLPCVSLQVLDSVSRRQRLTLRSDAAAAGWFVRAFYSIMPASLRRSMFSSRSLSPPGIAGSTSLLYLLLQGHAPIGLRQRGNKDVLIAFSRWIPGRAIEDLLW